MVFAGLGAREGHDTLYNDVETKYALSLCKRHPGSSSSQGAMLFGMVDGNEGKWDG